MLKFSVKINQKGALLSSHIVSWKHMKNFVAHVNSVAKRCCIKDWESIRLIHVLE